MLSACFSSAQGYGWELDTSRFPPDPATLPARLENMRAGQVRDAVKKGAHCLLPVVTLEAIGDDSPLGMDPAQYKAIEDMARTFRREAVIAPPIYYTPTGYVLSGPLEGTFDINLDTFADYLEEVIVTLSEVGFAGIQIVVVHNPHIVENPPFAKKDRSPVYAACRFVRGDIFNNRWKDPQVGKNWWSFTLSKRSGTSGSGKPVNTKRLTEIKIKTLAKIKNSSDTKTSNKWQLPLRLERMRPSELKRAVAQNLPCFVPTGVIENHGNQNPVGCDVFESQEPVLQAAGRLPAVVAPSVWYGPTGYAVTGPKLGTTDINGRVYQNYIQGICQGLVAMGFRNIIFVQVHQGVDGPQFTATDMAIAQYRCRLYKDPNYGFGWGRKDKKWCDKKIPTIEVIMPPLFQGDHAGKNETSWMLYYRPEYTDLSLIRPGDYPFNDLRNAADATVEWGKEMAVGKNGSGGTVGGLEQIIRQCTNLKDKQIK